MRITLPQVLERGSHLPLVILWLTWHPKYPGDDPYSQGIGDDGNEGCSVDGVAIVGQWLKYLRKLRNLHKRSEQGGAEQINPGGEVTEIEVEEVQDKAGEQKHEYAKERYEQELVEHFDDASEESLQTSPESLYPRFMREQPCRYFSCDARKDWFSNVAVEGRVIFCFASLTLHDFWLAL